MQRERVRLIDIILVIIIAISLSACGGQEEVKLSEFPELEKFQETQMTKLEATAHPEDFAAASSNACSGIKTFADVEGWSLPEDTVDICIKKLSNYYNNYRKWPAATGNPSPSYVLANGLSFALGIERDNYLGSRFEQTFEGLLKAQRDTFWP